MTDLSLPLPIDERRVTERFPAMRVRQPIGDIIIAKMTSQQIQRITFFDVRRRLQELRDVERYLGIQRPLNTARVDDLKRYVNFSDATFPTSIIISVDSDYAEFDEDRMELTISNTRKGEDAPDIMIKNSCRVIDGQHRIAGLEGVGDSEFDVIVSVFVGSDIADQAYVFATVNLEQTKVNPSLAYDLFELAKARSPYKACHQIAVALDTTEGSPFYQKIKRLGVTTEGRSNETITQATFVNALVGYISNDPKADRDVLLRRKTLTPVSGNAERKFCFRNLFIEGDDIKIGKIVEQYFLAVDRKWPEAWRFKGTGLMLNRTNGFRALMKIFGRAYAHWGAPGEFVSSDNFFQLFDRVNVDSKYFTVDRFRPGSSGEAELRSFLESSMFVS
jgi:DGQHR domain-containing protein